VTSARADLAPGDVQQVGPADPAAAGALESDQRELGPRELEARPIASVM
jgi:hypothetical protein